MPVYHSIQNDWKGAVSCGSALLPLKTKVKGPAPPCKTTDQDIIDEAITNFRANVLFRSFKPEGTADLTMAYLTVFIGQILREFQKQKTKNDAKSKITSVSMDTNFAIPGDKTFCLAGFFTTPANRTEGDSFRQYYRQAREELVNRLVDLAYDDKGNPNKWWMSFAKRKFMNITST